MRSLTTIPYLVRCAVVAVVFMIAVGLLFGPAGLMPEPPRADAAIPAEAKEPPAALAREFIDRPHDKGNLTARRTMDGTPLGNYLYRVQIHGSGGLFGWPRPESPVVSSVSVSHVNVETKQIQVADWNVDALAWSAGQVIELSSDETDEQNTAGVLSSVLVRDVT